MSNPQQNYYYYATPGVVGQTPNATQWGATGTAYAYGGNTGATAGTPEAMYQQQQYWAAMQQQAMYQMPAMYHQYAMPAAGATQPAHEQAVPTDDFGEFASAASATAAPSAFHPTGLASAVPSSYSTFGSMVGASLPHAGLTPTPGVGSAPTGTSSSYSSASAFSSLSATPSAGSSSGTVNSFFSSIMKPAAASTALAPSSAAPAPARGPSLNALASGPPATAAFRSAPLASASLLEPSVSAPASSFSASQSAASLSGEFEDFVSAPKASPAAASSAMPSFSSSLAVAGTPSPPLSSGAPHSSQPTMTGQPAAVGAASQPAAALSPLASSSSPAPASAASDFDLFFSAAPAAPSTSRTATPPASQQSSAPSLLSASMPSPSPPASQLSAGLPSNGFDEDWTFSSAGPKAASTPSAPSKAPAPTTSSSNLDALMHKFSNIEKRTLAGEAAKKPDQVSRPAQPATQSAASKVQSTRAFNWNDDSYKNIFANIATEAPQPSAAPAAEDDFGDFVSERATSSADAPGFNAYAYPVGANDFAGSAFAAPSQQVAGPPQSFETAPPGFAAAFPPAASGMSVSDYNMAAYHQMLAVSAAMMPYATQQQPTMPESVPTSAPAAQPSQAEDDEWTSFASNPSAAAEPSTTASVASEPSSSFSGLSFDPPLSSSAALSSSSVPPFAVSAAPPMPTSASAAFPSPSLIASGGGIPLLPSPDVARAMEAEAHKQHHAADGSASSEFGSFASFDKGAAAASPAGEKAKSARPGQVDWHEQAMRQTQVHLQQGSVIFQQLVEVSNAAMLSSTLRSEKVDAYLLGLCEVYKIGRRVGKNWESDMAKDLALEIDTAWVVFKEVIAGLNFKPLADLQRWQEQLEKNDKQAWSGRSRCPLCLASVTPLDVQLTLQGSLYHAPCANFYSSLRQIPSS